MESVVPAVMQPEWRGHGPALAILPPHSVSFLPLSLASGRFREKASILHKIAKKKCQVDENERQNGAANHVGK